MINDDHSKDNVKKVLRQIDLALANKGIGGHQERLLRIYKTVMAVEKHSNCFVSKFQGEDEKEEHANFFRTFDEVNKPSLNLHTDLQTKKVEFEFEDADPKKKNFKIGMDELLTYVENELGITTIEDSSDDGGKKDEKDTNNNVDKKKLRNKELDKKFFNIELKLRAFIKENETYDIFSKSAFKSFIEDQRLKTPGSMKSKGKELTSPITYNFFKEKEVIEVCQKRYSLNQQHLKNNLDKFSQGINPDHHQPKFLTNDKFKTSQVNKDKKVGEMAKISKFIPDDDDEDCIKENRDEDLVTPKLESKHSFNFKRGSIFADEKAFSKDNEHFLYNEKEEDDDQSDISSPTKSFTRSPAKSPGKRDVNVKFNI